MLLSANVTVIVLVPSNVFVIALVPLNISGVVVVTDCAVMVSVPTSQVKVVVTGI
jgi:hypothetical protein